MSLKRWLRKLGLFRRKKFTNIDDVVSFIQRQIQGSNQLPGYRWIHLKCIQSGLVVTQETVRLLLKLLDPVGVLLRSRRRLRRRRYYSKGPDFLWHLDGYDKLKPYGICISGCIDGFSRSIIWLEAYKTNNDPKVIASYYVEAVKARQGCPRIIRADRGTENGYIEQMQIFLRRNHTDSFAGSKSFLYGRSTSNQRIECWWSTMRKQNSQFWINQFANIRDDGLFSGSFLDVNIIQFCFMNLIQAELDEVARIWNSHRIRSSRNQTAPSGRPLMMYSVPELYETSHQIRDVDVEEICVCEGECTPKSEYPCDETIFELSCIIMEENGWFKPSDPFAAAQLYTSLRGAFNAVL
ncbi:uncharacterized protein LOC144344733 [Saccoglossus kowalevskii]